MALVIVDYSHLLVGGLEGSGCGLFKASLTMAAKALRRGAPSRRSLF